MCNFTKIGGIQKGVHNFLGTKTTDLAQLKLSTQ